MSMSKDIGFIQYLNILILAIIHLQVEDIALALQHLRLILDAHLLVRDHRQQTVPFAVAQIQIIQKLQLASEVPQQTVFILHLHQLIALTL